MRPWRCRGKNTQWTPQSRNCSCRPVITAHVVLDLWHHQFLYRCPRRPELVAPSVLGIRCRDSALTDAVLLTWSYLLLLVASITVHVVLNLWHHQFLVFVVVTALSQTTRRTLDLVISSTSCCQYRCPRRPELVAPSVLGIRCRDSALTDAVLLTWSYLPLLVASIAVHIVLNCIIINQFTCKQFFEHGAKEMISAINNGVFGTLSPDCHENRECMSLFSRDLPNGLARSFKFEQTGAKIHYYILTGRQSNGSRLNVW
ncbi:hypothetical protein J6590_071994 [Homalodisca vitripennis]|nr:hypothetical protein J6590_071994 [Homalodisca vitripennis]